MKVFFQPAVAKSAAGFLLLLALSSLSHAQAPDIQTRYVTEKGACAALQEHRVEISEGRITGPGFNCTLGAGRPAGTGLEAFEASCIVDGSTREGFLALDLGNYSDHFRLQLPGREDWLSLYPCTKVPGLK